MNEFGSRAGASRPPRVVVLGGYRDALGMSGHGFQRALAATADTVQLDSSRPVRDGFRLYRAASALIARGAFELVHVLDPRLAPIGAMLRCRRHVPATVTLTGDAMRPRGPWAALARRSIDTFDEAFVSEDALPAVQRCRGVRSPLYPMPPVARELPMPSPGDVARVLRALRGLDPEQPLVGVPWPRNGGDFRWFRDVVMPHLATQPAFLLLGVGSRRELRLMLHAAGVQSEVRAVTGSLTASLIAAAARMVDAFAVPAPSRARVGGGGALLMALTVSGVPVVTDAATFDCVPAHETSGLMVDTGDERAFVSALDNVLGLPAIQRHFLGEEIARSTIREWPWRPVAEAYSERFSAILGRPVIPEMLRAA